jgi:hypothetical protein
MKIKLIFAQTQYDQGNMWTAIKTTEVEVPDELKEKYDTFDWHLVGMEIK